VETHRKRIIAKLGVNNTVGLVKFAVRHGLIDA
jgi:DNA-binding CsgD family transcriptional regulator